MKKRLTISLVAAISLFGLASCSTESTTSSSSSASSSTSPTPSYKIKSISTKVADDYSYDISFTTDKTVSDEVSWYLSGDTKYDTSDTKLDVTEDSGTYSFGYDGNSIDFYVLMVGASDSTVYAKANIVLPSFNLDVEAGTGDDQGKDVLTFEFMDNDHSPDDYIDQGSVAIYSSASDTFDESQATEVASDLTLKEGMDAIKVNSSDNSYYFVTLTLSGEKYVSQAFERGKAFGSDLVAFSKATVSADGKLTVTGNATGSQKTNALLVSTAADSQIAIEATSSDSDLTATFDLSTLSKESTNYSVYWTLGAGIFVDVPGSILDITSDEVFAESGIVATSSEIYKFNSANNLTVSFSSRALVNIVSSGFENIAGDNATVDFTVEGLYDASFASDSTSAISDPTLLIGNDNDATDFFTAPLTLDSDKGTFTVSIDLSGLQRTQRWYGVYVFLNSSEMKDDTGAAQYANASYTLTHSDANDLDQTAEIAGSVRYALSNNEAQDNNNLKIYASDLSFNPESGTFSIENDKVIFTLSGTAGPESTYTVVISADNDPDGSSGYENRTYYQNSFTAALDGSFSCDIDVTDIISGLNYDIYIFQGTDISNSNNRIELTHDNFMDSYRGVLSYGGFIYCIKDPYNGWYKLEKDTDTTKVYEINQEATSGDIVFSGVLNSGANSASTIGLINTSTGEITAATMGLQNGSYSASVDASALSKGSYDVVLLSGPDSATATVTQTIYPDYLQNSWKSDAFTVGDNTVSFAQEDGSASYSWALVMNVQ